MSRKSWLWVLLLAVVVVTLVVLVTRSQPSHSPQARADRLAHELACPECEGESVADSNSATRALMSALDQPAISSGSAMLLAALRDDSRLKCWKIMPIERCASRNSRPVSAEMSL